MRLETVDLRFAALTYVSAMGAATLAEGFGRGAGIVDIAQVAVRCPQPEVPTMLDWLRTGLAHATVDGPAAAAPALRRALESSEHGGVAAQASGHHATRSG